MPVKNATHAKTNGTGPPGRPVLVAGGAGFLGSHLCERLLREGHSVVCLDNFSTSDPCNIEHLHDYESFRLIEARLDA